MSKKPKVSQVETVKTTYPQLAAETKHLSSAIGELAGTISTVESTLHRIGLNVSAWHTIVQGQNDDIGYVWSRAIGYTRLNERWRIALRERSQEIGQEPDQQTWTFADAPPWMILEAAGKIPELLEELIERTQDMAKNIRSKNAEVTQLAAVLEQLAADISQGGK